MNPNILAVTNKNRLLFIYIFAKFKHLFENISNSQLASSLLFFIEDNCS